MQPIFPQLLKVWHKTNSFQKTALLFVLFSFFALLLYFPLKPRASSYTPLFKTPIPSSDSTAIKAYLDRFSIPFKEVKEKGIFVPEEQADKIRTELFEANISKQGHAKGFELFDTNTWIKGEKELQVLEMRALKGQLEKDLMGYESIKNASVILDIPPKSHFSQVPYKTKASCILTLVPGARLTHSQLIAISNHLAGAVRGLEPNMIAISDTTGKVYKAIDPEAKETALEYATLLLEDDAKSVISAFLNKVAGKEGHLLTVTASKSLKEGKTALSVGAILDENVLKDRNLDKEAFRQALANQLASLSKGFNADIEINVEFIPFERKEEPKQIEERKPNNLGFAFIFSLAILAFFFVIFFLRQKPHGKKGRGSEEVASLTRVDLQRLIESMKNESPKTIAMMISYLEPRKAERLIASFPEKIQEAILIELEKEEI